MADLLLGEDAFYSKATTAVEVANHLRDEEEAIAPPATAKGIWTKTAYTGKLALVTGEAPHTPALTRQLSSIAPIRTLSLILGTAEFGFAGNRRQRRDWQGDGVCAGAGWHGLGRHPPPSLPSPLPPLHLASFVLFDR